MPQQSEESIPADAAYAAAEDRAVRLTRALIMAEGRIVWLTRQLAAALQQVNAKEEEIVSLGGRTTGDPEGGGDDGADEDPPGYTEAVGQAD